MPRLHYYGGGSYEHLIQDLLAYARLTTEKERPSSIALDEDLEAALTHLERAVTCERGATGRTIRCLS